eukprot:Nk52_evm92s2192 gene=Nk52_evmTU92s2192
MVSSSSPQGNMKKSGGVFKRTKKKQTSINFKFSGAKLTTSNVEPCISNRTASNVALMEEVKEFMKKRSALEAEYAANLKSLSTSFLQKRKWPAEREANGMDGLPGSTILDTWRSFLRESVEQSMTKKRLSEYICSEFTEKLKSFSKAYTSTVGARSHDEAKIVCEHIEQCMVELEMAKKQYRDSVVLHNLAKEKEQALSKKASQVMSSDSDLKLANSRVKLNEAKLMVDNSKNEYMLTIEATNEKMDYFYGDVLPGLVMNIDSPICTFFKEAFKGLSAILNESSEELRRLGQDMAEKSSAISKEYECQLFCQAHQEALTNSQKAKFERQEGDGNGENILIDDTCFHIESRNRSALELKYKKLRQVCTKQGKSWEISHKQYDGLVHMAEVSLTKPEFSNSKANHDIEKQLEELFQESLNSKAELLSASASIRVLGDHGIGGTWMSSSMDSLLSTDLTLTSNSPTSSPPMAGKPPVAEETPVFSPPVTDVDSEGEAFERSTNGVVGKRCVALYDYEARHSDELTLWEDDVLFVTDFVEGGWYEGRNAKGEVGLFPTTYVEMLQTGSGDNSRTFNVQDSASKPNMLRGATSPALQVSPDSEANKKRANYARSKTEGAKPRGVIYARALYDNDATSSDELSFQAGSLIEIISKNTGEEGYWEGRIHGKRGIFPKILVQSLHF